MNLEVLRGVFGNAPFSAREAGIALGIASAASALTRWKQAGLIARTDRGVYVILQEPRTAAIGMRIEREDVERRDADSIRALTDIAKRRWAEAVKAGKIEPHGTGFRVRVGP